MRSIQNLSVLATTLLFVAAPASAIDARSIGLGGSVVANGAGVHGTLENPSTMMRLQRDGQRIHLRAGASLDVRDSGKLYEELSKEENDNLADSIEDGIDALSGQAVSADCAILLATGQVNSSNEDTVCVQNTGTLGADASQVLDLLNVVDGKDASVRVAGDFGFALTSTKVPFAIHLHVSAAAYGKPEVADEDRSYVGTFADVLEDNQVLVGEVDEDVINVVGEALSVQQPEDALQSEVIASALVRQQLGLSFATTLPIAAVNVDLGVTPKFSKLRAGNLDNTIADTFDETAEGLQDQFENSEVEESSFTMDLGASASVAVLPVPLRVAAVLRNVIPESIETENGFEFETTPQLIVGGVFDLGIVSVNTDLALNSAKIDNFETQPMSLGVEFGTRLFAIRGGVSVDAARDDDATALSVGFGLGPLQVGARVAGLEAAQASMQLSFSF